MLKINNLVRLVISIAVPLLVGFISGLFTMKSVQVWYKIINKPAFTPPSWLFAPVWTVLYIAMGVAAYLVWTKGLNTSGVKTALLVFIVQLFLNGLWSVVFFGLKSPLGGLVVIFLLFAAIVITFLTFWPLSRPAALLLIPYLLWVSFATALNYSILVLN
jgi:benzodiazapine receptor